MSRATLIEVGFPEERVVALTDGEMEQFAARLGKAYREKGFPDDVQTQTRRMLEGGKNSPNGVYGQGKEELNAFPRFALDHSLNKQSERRNNLISPDFTQVKMSVASRR